MDSETDSSIAVITVVTDRRRRRRARLFTASPYRHLLLLLPFLFYVFLSLLKTRFGQVVTLTDR